MSTGPQPPRKLIVGISGASGAIYGIRLLELLSGTDIETHLVLSKAAQATITYETDLTPSDVKALADEVHSHGDIGATIASGSFKTAGMIIAPCSIKTMSEISSGITGNLMSRAADVCLKERRRVVLAVRETPLHLGHIRTMANVTEMGAIVYPPVPAFYAQPDNLQDMVDHSVGRMLDLFGFDLGVVKRWKSETETSPKATERS